LENYGKIKLIIEKLAVSMKGAMVQETVFIEQGVATPCSSI
jgi:hypothetical protein